MGQDIAALTGWGLAMLATCEPAGVPADQHGAVGLGLTMAAGARQKLDKLTLLVPSNLEPFGLWVEQLVAESTARMASASCRSLVRPRRRRASTEAIASTSGFGTPVTPTLRATRSRPSSRGWRHPSSTSRCRMPPRSGRGVVRWEIATAVAGALLEINPFDEPNV